MKTCGLSHRRYVSPLPIPKKRPLLTASGDAFEAHGSTVTMTQNYNSTVAVCESWPRHASISSIFKHSNLSGRLTTPYEGAHTTSCSVLAAIDHNTHSNIQAMPIPVKSLLISSDFSEMSMS